MAGPSWDPVEVEVRCARCASARPEQVPPLLATATLPPSTSTIFVHVPHRLSEKEAEFWNRGKVRAEDPDLPRTGQLWDQPTVEGTAYAFECRRCHAKPKISQSRFKLEARKAASRGYHLLLNPSGVMRRGVTAT